MTQNPQKFLKKYVFIVFLLLDLLLLKLDRVGGVGTIHTSSN